MIFAFSFDGNSIIKTMVLREIKVVRKEYC